MLERRNFLSIEEVTNLSRLAQELVIKSMEFQSAKTIGAYFPIGSEVLTETIIDVAKRQGKLVSLPRTEGYRIKFYEITSTDDLIAGRFGTNEPRPTSPAGPLDLMIVPAVAFDKNGSRIGYGKGYYDRFISDKQAVFSMGLGYNFQVVNELPLGRFDRKICALATEKEIVYF